MLLLLYCSGSHTHNVFVQGGDAEEHRAESERNNSYDSLVVLHLNVVTGYEALLAVQLGSVPVHVVLHVQDLQVGQRDVPRGRINKDSKALRVEEAYVRRSLF